MPRRVLQGVVVSDAANKTVSVKVERRVLHPIYGKTVKRARTYAVHDSENRHKKGDEVRIIESKPISKTKTWVIFEG